MTNARRLLGLMLLVSATTSCFLRKKQDTEGLVWQPVTIAIVNHNWQEVVVYAIVGSNRQRIGTVPSVKEVTFELPTALISLPGTVNLLLDPIGSRSTYRTGDIAIGSGQRIRVVVENQLSLSNWTVQQY